MVTYYVVHKGRNPGIYTSWDKCKKEIEKFEGAIFKKFTDKNEASAFLKVGFGEGKKPRIVTRRENEDKKNNEKILDETICEEETIFVYTDGSCIRLENTTKAGYGIYIPEKNIQVSKPLLNQKATNNRAELTAIIDSIKYLDEDDLINKKICIFTDSQYSMYIFNGTGERYEKDGYKKDGVDVPNIDLIKKLLEIKRTYNVKLLKVRAHTDKNDKHSIGNKIADKLATEGASEKNCNNNSQSKLLLSVSTISNQKKSEYDDDSDNDDDNDSDDNYKKNINDNNKSHLKKMKLKSTKLTTWLVKS
jgi:ribonuclease HI